MREGHCACAHSEALHDPVSRRCVVTLPPFEEEELPAWACPCRRFTAAIPPAGPWVWHDRTQSWRGVQAS